MQSRIRPRSGRASPSRELTPDIVGRAQETSFSQCATKEGQLAQADRSSFLLDPVVQDRSRPPLGRSSMSTTKRWEANYDCRWLLWCTLEGEEQPMTAHWMFMWGWVDW
jgi:hypothetical protein